ncbi:MAG: GNAT family N-acetyltransferase [Clostridia bacterium]
MEIRKYKTADCTEIAELFFETVHTINAKDYTKSQLDVWANGKIDIAAWDKSFLEHNTLVAEENNIIVGFGDMDNDGYFDRLFVHKDYQGKGIAKAIATELERLAEMQGILVFSTHASVTAKPFFEKRGYCVVSENKVVRNGVELTNFIMEKPLAK